MIRRGTEFILFLMLVLAGAPISHAESKGDALDFNEVYSLIRTNAQGVTDAELHRAAIQGLVAELAPKVTLITNVSAHAEAQPLGKTNLFENIGYLRVLSIGDGVAPAIRDAYRGMNSTNKIAGLVLDLRYADGSDYNAAVAVADLFAAKATPLLNWGAGTVSSHQKTNAITEPVAILVNQQTSGAAEALAAALREADAGLIIGSRTAGRAAVTRDFPLKNGEVLRIATAPVLLGDGAALSSQGVKPDIDVTVSVEDEKSFYADAFLVKSNDIASLSSTNAPVGTNQASHRIRFNEAELVRARKQGIDLDAVEEGAFPAPDSRPETPVVRDPALARALDLLKGLAVVRQSRS